ncbi:MAG: hypothetical protein ACJA01_001027 [Saprospiraceae bacterium]|jgi:hypothetical protein
MYYHGQGTCFTTQLRYYQLLATAGGTLPDNYEYHVTMILKNITTDVLTPSIQTAKAPP